MAGDVAGRAFFARRPRTAALVTLAAAAVVVGGLVLSPNLHRTGRTTRSAAPG